MAKYRCKVIKMVLKIYSEVPLDKSMQHIATSLPVYIEIQLTSFCVMHAFTEGFFRKHFKTAVVLWMPFKSQFRDGLCVLIMYASLKSKMSQLFALSVIVALFLIWQILNLFKLKELLSTLNKSTI